MRKFDKYKNNLFIQTTPSGDYIISYFTRVARIDYKEKRAIVLEWHSPTTTKHINYAAQQLGLSVVNIEDLCVKRVSAQDGEVSMVTIDDAMNSLKGYWKKPEEIKEWLKEPNGLWNSFYQYKQVVGITREEIYTLIFNQNYYQ